MVRVANVVAVHNLPCRLGPSQDDECGGCVGTMEVGRNGRSVHCKQKKKQFLA